MAFVGRERELARLAASLERAARGERVSVCLTGTSGVGSTRLLGELAERLRGLPQVTVVRGSAYAPLQGTPYAAVREALTGALWTLDPARLEAVTGPHRHELRQLLPQLGDRLAGPADPDDEPFQVSPDQRAGRTAEAVLGLLERLAGDGVVLLVLEDLHWADAGTRRLVETMLRVGRPLPLCLVVSYRPEELHVRHPMRALATTLETEPGVERVALPPLERHQLMALLEHLLGERPSGGFVAAVASASGGNPLVAEHLVAARQARIRLSDPFDQIVGARVAALPAGAVRCLRLLAAARRPLPVALIRQADLPGGRLPASAIAEAVASGLAHETVDREGATLAGIHHERYAEAMEALALPGERQPAHDALARALAGEPAEQAWHWEAAMRFGLARDAHVLAGEAAVEVEPAGTAFFHDQRALELLDVHDAHPGALALAGSAEDELVLRTADAAFADDNPRRAADLVQQLIDQRSSVTQLSEAARRGEAARRDLQRQLGMLHLRMGQYQAASGDLGSAIAACESAVQLVPREPASAERARVLGALAQQQMLDGRFERSAVLAEEACVTARAVEGGGAAAELGHATCTLAVDRAYAGHIDDALRLLDEATGVALYARRLDDLMRAWANRTHILELDARLEPALAAARDGIAAAGRFGAELAYGSFLRGNAADIMLKLGRWADAEAEARAALELSPSRLTLEPAAGARLGARGVAGGRGGQPGRRPDPPPARVGARRPVDGDGAADRGELCPVARRPGRRRARRSQRVAPGGRFHRLAPGGPRRLDDAGSVCRGRRCGPGPARHLPGGDRRRIRDVGPGPDRAARRRHHDAPDRRRASRGRPARGHGPGAPRPTPRPARRGRLGPHRHRLVRPPRAVPDGQGPLVAGRRAAA